jgi:hypothetical protein
MKKMTTIALLIGLTILLSSCAGGGRTRGVYHHHHRYGPWWGSRGYYSDRVIVVPDKEPVVEATPLPSGPEEMPDMGMPDMDFGDMGGDW